MGIIIDTGVLYAFYNNKDDNYEIAKNIISDILDGKYGQPIILDYVFDELMSLIQYRTKRNDLATKVGNEILKHNAYHFTHIIPSAIAIAWELFANQSGKKFMSFTDTILIAMARELQLLTIASFDNRMKSFKDIKIVDY